MTRRRRTSLFLMMAALTVGGGCSANLAGCNANSGGGGQQQGNDLDSMSTTELSIGEIAFKAWVATTEEQRNKGLMFVETDQMKSLEDGTERGMLFVFERERNLNFWMENTIIPLDIAYARSDGTIVKIHTMTPLDTRFNQYPSGEPARYALEVNAGIFAAKGIAKGDVIKIPD